MSLDLTTRSATASPVAPRLLVSALVPLFLFMSLAHLTIEGDSASTMTSAEVGERGFWWIAVAILWVLPVVMAGVAFARLTSSDHPGPVRLLSITGIGLLVAHVVAQAAVVAFDDSPTLADSSTFALAILLSLLGWWLIDVLAAGICLHLYRRGGPARKTAAVTGIVTALFLVLEIAIYLPALIGDGELHDTVGLPPMLLPLCWAVLGGVIWRARARSAGSASGSRR